jgi:anti-sigma factor RsiW
MTCAEARGAIDAYLDDELGVLEALRVQGHLRRCAGCRQVMDSEATLHALLEADVLHDEPPERLRQRIRQQCAALVSAEPRVPARRRPSALFGAYLSGAVMGVLLLAIVIIPGSRGLVGGHLAVDAVAWHRHHATGPIHALEVRTHDPALLATWLKSRLGVTVPFPSVSVRGERLVGARVAAIAERQAAHVLYEGEGRRVSLFATRRPFRPSTDGAEHMVEGLELYTATLDGVSVAWWNDGGHLYVAAVETGEADLMALAAPCVRLDWNGPPRLRRAGSDHERSSTHDSCRWNSRASEPGPARSAHGVCRARLGPLVPARVRRVRPADHTDPNLPTVASPSTPLRASCGGPTTDGQVDAL